MLVLICWRRFFSQSTCCCAAACADCFLCRDAYRAPADGPPWVFSYESREWREDGKRVRDELLTFIAGSFSFVYN